MSYEHKDGFGSLFRNELKDAESQQPDYRGTIMLGGVVYEIAGWKKEGKKGAFLSLKGQLPRNREAEPVETRRSRRPEPDADVPF